MNSETNGTLSEHVYGFKSVEDLAVILRTEPNAKDVANHIFGLAYQNVDMEAQYLDSLEEFINERYLRVADDWELVSLCSLPFGTKVLFYGEKFVLSSNHPQDYCPTYHERKDNLQRWLVSPSGSCTGVWPSTIAAKKKVAEQKKEDSKAENIIQILSVKSESGDEYGPFLFEEQISGEQLFRFLQKNTSKCECEIYAPDKDGCPGWMGTNLHLSWSRQKILKVGK